MSHDRCNVKQLKVAYLILISWVFLVTIVSCVNGLPQDLQNESSFIEQYREKRQQFTFPLNQIFQFNAAETGSETSANIENNFTFNPNVAGNGATDLQDGSAVAEVQQQTQNQQLTQVFSNLIEAAAIQQAITPQEIVRTVMNSGLK